MSNHTGTVDWWKFHLIISVFDSYNAKTVLAANKCKNSDPVTIVRVFFVVIFIVNRWGCNFKIDINNIFSCSNYLNTRTLGAYGLLVLAPAEGVGALRAPCQVWVIFLKLFFTCLTFCFITFFVLFLKLFFKLFFWLFFCWLFLTFIFFKFFFTFFNFCFDFLTFFLNFFFDFFDFFFIFVYNFF